MTIKKSLISVAASAAIIAAVTGCSSDSTTAAATPAAASGTSTIQSAVQAVDGYIYNATAKAYYLSEDNASMQTIAMTSTPTTKDVVSGVVTLGSSTYSLPTDTNASVKSRIKFFEITNAPSSTAGTIFTPATYIESDNVDGYDTNDTLFVGNTIFAPGNSAIASPLTSMIVSSNAATFGTTTTVPTSLVDLNTTVFEGIEANATAIAAKLGLGDVDLLTDDPIQLATENPTFKLVSAMMLGANAADQAAILAATAATSLAETLTLVSTLPNAQGAALAGVLAPLAANGAFTTDTVAGMNVEASVAAGSIKTLEAPVLTGKFPLSAIEINSALSSTYVGSGAKLANDGISVDLNLTNVDGNISNTAFTLLISLTGDKAYVSGSDSNNSGAVIASIPFEINATKSGSTQTIATTVSDSSIVTLEAKASDGSQVVSKSDINASTMGIDATSHIIVDNTNMQVVFEIEDIAQQLITAADANLTGSTGLSAATDLNGIGNLQIALVDSTGSIIGVTADGLNSTPIAKADFSSITGSIAATSAIKIHSNALTDLRTTGNGANNAPDGDINTTVVGFNGAATTGSKAATDTNSSAAVVVNDDTTLAFTVTADGTDTLEQNTTVTFTPGNFITDVNSSALSALVKATSTSNQTVANVFDVNATSLTASGEQNTTIKAVITDEFGKATTRTMYITVNRAPVLLGTYSGNTLQLVTDYDGALTYCDVNITDRNGTALTADLNETYQDFNVSATAARIGIRLIDNNKTIEFNTTIPTDLNMTVQVEAGDKYGFGDINDTRIYTK